MENKLITMPSTRAYIIYPKLYVDATLENFSPTHPSQQHALEKVERYVSFFDDEIGFYGKGAIPTGLFLSGEVGTGKTHLAISAMKAIAERNIECHFVDVVQALHQLRPPKNDEKFFYHLTEVELLVLDDLGAQKDTEWTLEQLTAIVNARLNEEAPTIITSNLTLEEFQDTLEHRRIASRIKQLCDLILLRGNDYRDKVVRDRRKGNV